VRVGLVNSGFLGHASVARVVRAALADQRDLSIIDVNLSVALSPRDRIVRQLMCWGGRAPTNRVDALTFARWRRELHLGALAKRRLQAAEREEGPATVLHFHTQATAWASIARMRHTPSIVSIDITQRLASHEMPDGMRQWQYAACASYDRAVFQAARAIVSASQWAADDLVRDLPACADRVHVMPYPVPLDGFAAGWAGERAARVGPTRILFVGGDFPRKGGWDLIEAWRAARLGPEAELHLVTDWKLDERKLPRGTAVHAGVQAYTPQWFDQWRAADLFVLPTTGEAFGMVFQEAAAAGLPSIGTNLNAVPELVVDGQTGILVPVHDPAALAVALRQLVADSGIRRRMGEAARRRIGQISAPSAYGAHLARLMRDLSTARSYPAT
jgi:glycosyltransferase involved in cell wall biosynthesis